jgi:hypothetical protein
MKNNFDADGIFVLDYLSARSEPKENSHREGEVTTKLSTGTPDRAEHYQDSK